MKQVKETLVDIDILDRARLEGILDEVMLEEDYYEESHNK